MNAQVMEELWASGRGGGTCRLFVSVVIFFCLVFCDLFVIFCLTVAKDIIALHYISGDGSLLVAATFREVGVIVEFGCLKIDRQF
jgi:hypothetical protein